MARRASPRLAPGGAVHRALEEVFLRCDVGASVRRDPVEYVRRFRDPHDVELAALLASSVAFGNVVALRAKIEDVLARIGDSPARAADDEAGVRARLSTWRHRIYRGDDLAALLVGARRLQRAHGSLGACFSAHFAEAGTDLREGLARFVDALRAAGGLDRRTSRGARHLLPDPRATSGCKRLLLFLRWMVRGPDAIDVGLWRGRLRPAELLIPVDVHIHKLGRNLGLTDRASTSWRTTLQITEALRRFDRGDPARFDFALCHMGMLQRCPSRRDPIRCAGCGVRPVGRWWARAPGG